jgi:serralysin
MRAADLSGDEAVSRVAALAGRYATLSPEGAGVFSSEAPPIHAALRAPAGCCCGCCASTNLKFAGTGDAPQVMGAGSQDLLVARFDTDGPQSSLAIPGDTSTTATLAVGASVNGNLETTTDNDWYRIDLVAGQSYVFNLNGSGAPALADPFLELRDSSGTLIAIDDDAGPGINSQLRFTVQTSGTYFVNARSYFDADQAATTGGYTLSAAIGPPQDPLRTIDLGFTLTGTAFTFYFATQGETFGGETSLRDWTADERNTVIQAFAEYTAVLPLTFTSTANSATANFKFVLSDLEPGVLGQAARSGNGAIIAFDPTTSAFTSGRQANGLGFSTVLHEIGHGLGLAHPHDNSGNSEIMQGVLDDFGSFGTFEMNQTIFTIMSYNDGWESNGRPGALTSGNPFEPMALDLALLQQKYGAKPNVNVGDTVYSIPSLGWGTIYDTSGNDAIESLDASGSTIDLRAATLTSAIGGGGFPTTSKAVTSGGLTIAAGVVIENASGGAGPDTITGNGVTNLLRGREGADMLLGLAGGDTLEGAEGNDTLDGGDGDDFLDGGADADTLLGGAGNDQLDGGAGANSLDGGLGDDIFVLRANGADTITDAGGFDELRLLFSGITNYTLPSGFEILNFSSSVNIVVANGNGVDNFIYANAINSELYGLDGNDRLFGSVGNNRLEGGNGIDTLFGSDGDDALFGQIGNDRLEGEVGNDLGFAGEGDDVFIGGLGADQAFGENGLDLLFGGSGADILLGEFGNDRLFGEFDNDLLFGGVGDDEMQGEQGDDRLFGDVGADIMFGQDGNDEMQGENDNDRLFGGFGQDIMFGQAGNDEMQGEQDNDRLFGGFGADIMFGQAGADELQGEQDNDRLFGGQGADILFGQDGADELQGEEDNDRLFGGLGMDSLFGQAGNDELQGEEDNDVLSGGDGIDQLVGGAGADRLNGGADNDTLNGGSGGDFFIFAAGAGADTLNGFEDGLDVLDLRTYAGATFANTTILQQGADTLVTFVGGESVLLVGINAVNIDAADFLFT